MRLPANLLVSVLVMLALASPLAAQPSPAVSVRPFFLFSQQRFAAKETFDAAFGGSSFPFLGGGGQVLFSRYLFVDITISRFRQSGQRAFHLEGESVQLGIPLTASITPIELTAGFRFPVGMKRAIAPYVGGGFGSYKYTETADFAKAGDDVDLRRSGYLVVGGSEFRVHRWVVASADVQYTRVEGILGQGGVSEQVGEDNLGGVSARFRVMIGR